LPFQPAGRAATIYLPSLFSNHLPRFKLNSTGAPELGIWKAATVKSVSVGTAEITDPEQSWFRNGG
jgi:hypothetical protein